MLEGTGAVPVAVTTGRYLVCFTLLSPTVHRGPVRRDCLPASQTRRLRQQGTAPGPVSPWECEVGPGVSCKPPRCQPCFPRAPQRVSSPLSRVPGVQSGEPACVL